MPVVPKLSAASIEAIAKILGDTENGFTGAEIRQLLAESRIEDVMQGGTKWKFLHQALVTRQARDGAANSVLAFVKNAMMPVRYSSDQLRFQERREELNKILAFDGLIIQDDGGIQKSKAASTLEEASRRASRLREELLRRRVHGDILRFCRAELLQRNYFHAVFEATKSVADKIRVLSGLSYDGSRLVDEALGLGSTGIPRVAFNSLQTETEISEHKGLCNLLKGLFGTFRNTTAHAPKIMWNIEEQDAFDMMSLASLLHRRLDKATPTGRP